jgi:hypothetical protein
LFVLATLLVNREEGRRVRLAFGATTEQGSLYSTSGVRISRLLGGEVVLGTGSCPIPG